jgi:hypothetical protein
MDTNTKTILLWSGVAVLVVAGIVMLFASMGGSKNNAAIDVNTIYTNAASTIAAQEQTLEAGMKSATPSPASSLPTATVTPLFTPTFQQLVSTPLPTIKPVTAGGAVGCDAAVYVSDVTIPDGTTVAAGQHFTKTWKVSNTGSCTWTTTYQLTFVSGDSLGGKSTALPKEVKPGESADISVVLTMTSATGKISGTWRLANDKGQTFGDGLTVVVSSGATATAVPPTVTKSVAYP